MSRSLKRQIELLYMSLAITRAVFPVFIYPQQHENNKKNKNKNTFSSYVYLLRGELNFIQGRKAPSVALLQHASFSNILLLLLFFMIFSTIIV